MDLVGRHGFDVLDGARLDDGEQSLVVAVRTAARFRNATSFRRGRGRRGGLVGGRCAALEQVGWDLLAVTAGGGRGVGGGGQGVTGIGVTCGLVAAFSLRLGPRLGGSFAEVFGNLNHGSDLTPTAARKCRRPCGRARSGRPGR